MTLQELQQEAIKEFAEYMTNGYSGGNNGLRCSNCDNKYSGEASIIQLCPMCKANSLITKAYEKGKKETEFKILSYFKKVEEERWKDADHCSCLGYAIATYKDY
jgi:hypothetical protein